MKVAHIKQPLYLLQTETFVHARVTNPVCERPVPVLTHSVAPEFANCAEIRFFELCRLAKLRRRLDLALDFRFQIVPYYHQVLHHLKPDLVHAHFSGAGLSVLFSAKRLRIPLVINFYGVETKYHLSDPSWCSAYRKLAQSDATFVCSSDVMKRDMVAFGFKPEKVEVVRCGVDTNLFDGAAKECEPAHQLRLLTVARLHEEKGLKYLLEACGLLIQSGFSAWTLRIAGEGPLQDELVNQSRSLGLDGWVSFVGQRTTIEVAQEMREAHLFILPSMEETQGVVFQEAQSTRTPVIGTNVGGIPEGVTDGVTGFLVEPKNPQQIAEKILFVAKNPHCLATMGEAGRKLVRSRFDRSEEYAQLARLYERMLVEN